MKNFISYLNSNYYEEALPGNKISLLLLKDSRYKAVYYLNPDKGKISDRTQIIKNIIEYKFIQ